MRTASYEFFILHCLVVYAIPVLRINGPRQWRSGLTISQKYIDQGAVCEEQSPHRELKGWTKTPNVSGIEAVRLDKPGKYSVKYSCDGLEDTRTVVVDRGYNPRCSEVTVGIDKDASPSAGFGHEIGRIGWCLRTTACVNIIEQRSVTIYGAAGANDGK